MRGVLPLCRMGIQSVYHKPYQEGLKLQVVSLLHSLKRAAGGIGLHVNADKTEYMSFNQMGWHLHTKGCSFKTSRQVHQLRNDINTWLAKAWTAIDRLSVIWKSDLTDKIKYSCFQAAVESITLNRTYMSSNHLDALRWL